MKITKIEREGDKFRVTFKPNWLEKFFGGKEKSLLYKDKGSYRPVGGNRVYICENGFETSPFGSLEAKIDNFRNKEKF